MEAPYQPSIFIHVPARDMMRGKFGSLATIANGLVVAE